MTSLWLSIRTLCGFYSYSKSTVTHSKKCYLATNGTPVHLLNFFQLTVSYVLTYILESTKIQITRQQKFIAERCALIPTLHPTIVELHPSPWCSSGGMKPISMLTKTHRSTPYNFVSEIMVCWFRFRGQLKILDLAFNIAMSIFPRCCQTRKHDIFKLILV